jgi:type III secretion system needle length determinant
MKIDLALMEQFAALGIGGAPAAGEQMSGEFAALLSQLIASDSVLNSASAGSADGENVETENLAEMLLAELGAELPVSGQPEAGEDETVSLPVIQALNGQLVLVADVTPKEGSTGGQIPPEASDLAAAKIKASAFIGNEQAGGQNTGSEKTANNPEGKGFFEQTVQMAKSDLPAAAQALNEEPGKSAGKTGSSIIGDEKLAGDSKAVPDAVKAVLDQAKSAPVDPKAVSDAAKALNEQKPADFRSYVESNARQGDIPANEAALSKPEQQASGSTESTQKPVDNLFRSENGATKAQAGTAASEQPVLGQQPSIQGDHGVRAEAVLQSQQNPNLRESVMQQLEGRMIYMRESGNNPAEMRMTLHPPELGEVTIRVFSKQGKLSASIIAETPLVKEILESSISELRQRLNFVQIQFEQLDVSTSGRQSGESDRQARNFNPDQLAQLGLDRAEHRIDGGVNDPLRASPDSETMGVDYFA